MTRRPLPDVPVIDWATFAAQFRWAQGEHVSVIGATGSGKTTLQTALLPLRRYVVAIGTKPTTKPDPSLQRIVREQGFHRVDSLPGWARKDPKVLIWPKFRSRLDLPHQANVIRATLDQAFAQGAWTVYIDEVGYLARQLRLGPAVVNLWTQGRSQHVTVLAGTQRPAWVPRDLYGAATHLFFMRVGDSYDRSRIAGMGGADSRVVQELVRVLDRHQFLYVNTVSGLMLKSRYDRASDPYRATA